MNNVPIYYYSAQRAREDGNLDRYRETLQACRLCKKDIETILAARFDGWHIDKVAPHELLCIHDPHIVSLVLSATVLYKVYDGRFSQTSRNWAASVRQLETSPESFVVETHPTILNGFIEMIAGNMLGCRIG